MSIYSILTHDHENVKKIFESLEDLKGERDKKSSHDEINDLFLEVKNELEIHSKAEDEVFYDQLLDNKSTHDLILECKEEHSLVLKLLKELGSSSKFDAKWFAKLHELKEMVEHHVEEEEKKLFKEAKQIFKKEDEKKIGDNFTQLKKELSKA